MSVYCVFLWLFGLFCFFSVIHSLLKITKQSQITIVDLHQIKGRDNKTRKRGKKPSRFESLKCLKILSTYFIETIMKASKIYIRESVHWFVDCVFWAWNAKIFTFYTNMYRVANNWHVCVYIRFFCVIFIIIVVVSVVIVDENTTQTIFIRGICIWIRLAWSSLSPLDSFLSVISPLICSVYAIVWYSR